MLTAPGDLLVLTPHAALDATGVAAGLAGATPMALGGTLARNWQPPVLPLAFTAWQLSASGLLLVPAALLAERTVPTITASNLTALARLSLIGAALTYVLWFRRIRRLALSVVSSLLFLSPLTAVLLGWVFLRQSMSLFQISGMGLVRGRIWLTQRVTNP